MEEPAEGPLPGDYDLQLVSDSTPTGLSGKDIAIIVAAVSRGGGGHRRDRADPRQAPAASALTRLPGARPKMLRSRARTRLSVRMRVDRRHVRRGVKRHPPVLATGDSRYRRRRQRRGRRDLRRPLDEALAAGRDAADDACAAVTVGADTEGVHRRCGRHRAELCARDPVVPTSTRSSRNTLASIHCRRPRSPSSTRCGGTSRSQVSSPSRDQAKILKDVSWRARRRPTAGRRHAGDRLNICDSAAYGGLFGSIVSV